MDARLLSKEVSVSNTVSFFNRVEKVLFYEVNRRLCRCGSWLSSGIDWRKLRRRGCSRHSNSASRACSDRGSVRYV